MRGAGTRRSPRGKDVRPGAGAGGKGRSYDLGRRGVKRPLPRFACGRTDASIGPFLHLFGSRAS